jgi:CrcB protein
MKQLLYLIAGGGAGTVARYVLSAFAHQYLDKRFPYGTLLVNLVGCALLGLFAVISETKLHLKPGIQFALMIGFCGAFTTFSTFILEISHMIKAGESAKAFAYLLASVTIGFLVFRLGMLVGERF